MAVRKYVYDGDAVLQETDGAGNTLTEYTRTGGGYGDLLSAYDGTAGKYYEPDALGSTDALADQSQAVADRWSYRAFGQATQTTGTDSTPFTWVGRQGYFADSETGLYLLGLGTRYYDPAIAKFISEDPIGLAGGDSSLYRYCGNGPVDRTDPTANQFGPTPAYRPPWELSPQPGGYGAGGFTPGWTSPIWPSTCPPPTNAPLIPPPPMPPRRCGAEIYPLLMKGLREVEQQFQAKSIRDRLTICDEMVGPFGWDIAELYNTGGPDRDFFSVGGCGSSGCKQNVTVNGHCYPAGEVNYVLWGRMSSLCNLLYLSESTWVVTPEKNIAGETLRYKWVFTFKDGTKVVAYSDSPSDLPFNIDWAYKRIEEFRRGMNLLPWRWGQLVSGSDIPGRKSWTKFGFDGNHGIFPESNLDAVCPPCKHVYQGSLIFRVGRTTFRAVRFLGDDPPRIEHNPGRLTPGEIKRPQGK